MKMGAIHFFLFVSSGILLWMSHCNVVVVVHFCKRNNNNNSKRKKQSSKKRLPEFYNRMIKTIYTHTHTLYSDQMEKHISYDDDGQMMKSYELNWKDIGSKKKYIQENLLYLYMCV